MSQESMLSHNAWFKVSSELSQLAANSLNVEEAFGGAVKRLSDFGQFALSVFVASDNKVEKTLSDGFSGEFVDRTSSLFNRGHRVWEPLRGTFGLPENYILWPTLAKDGIEAFCAWPLVTGSQFVGEFYVGTSQGDDHTLPPDVFMDSFSSALAQNIHRYQLVESNKNQVDRNKWQRQLLDAVVTGSRDGIILTDYDGTALIVNTVAQTYLGLGEGELVGKKIHKVDFRLLPLLELKENFHQKKETRITLPPFPSNGQARTYSVNVSSFEFNGTMYLLWCFVDKTRHLEMEEQIIRQDSKLSSLMDNSPMGVISCSPDGIITTNNSSVPAILGIEQYEIHIGQSIEAATPLLDTGITQCMKKCMADSKPFVKSHKVSHLSEEPSHLMVHYAPVRSPSGSALGVQAIIQDTTEQVKTRHSLQASEERYRLFFDNAPISLWECDFSNILEMLVSLPIPEDINFQDYFTGSSLPCKQYLQSIHIGDVNSTTNMVFKANHKREMKDLWTELIPPETYPNWMTFIWGLVQGKQTNQFDTSMRTFAGDQVFVNVRASIAQGYEGSMSKVLMSFQDVTSKKKAEQVLYRQLEMERMITKISIRFVSFQTFQSNSFICKSLEEIGITVGVDRVLLSHLQGSYHGENNHEWCSPKIKGDARSTVYFSESNVPWFFEKLTKMQTIRLETHDDFPEQGSKEKQLFEQLGIQSALLIPLVVGGEVLGALLLTTVQVQRRWPQETVTLLRIIADIFASALDRRRREREKAESSNLVRTAFDSMSSGMIVADGDNRIVLVNHAAVKILQSPSANMLLYKQIDEVFPKFLFDDSKKSSAEQYLMSLLLTDGKSHTLGYTYARSAYDHHIVVFRDVTTILETSQKQKQSEHLVRLGLITAKLSHDLKNPLSSILLGLGSLKETAELTKDDARILSNVLQEVRFLKDLLSGLLDSFRSEPVVPVITKIGTHIRRSVNRQEMLGAHKGIHVCLNEGPDDATAAIDGKGFARIMGNLIRNALDACTRGNRIEVGWRRLDEREKNEKFPQYEYSVLCVFIRDDGPGIPSDLLEKLFLPFSTTKDTGTGLGLCVVKELVEGHGGVIEVASSTDAVESGSQFCVFLAEGNRPSCKDIHRGDMNQCTCLQSSSGQCPVEAVGGQYVCWLYRSQLSIQENGSLCSECTNCEAFLRGDLSPYYNPVNTCGS